MTYRPLPTIDVTTSVLSGRREKILEHRLVSDLAELMLRRVGRVAGQGSVSDGLAALQALGPVKSLLARQMMYGSR